jgi:putative hemolysin
MEKTALIILVIGFCLVLSFLFSGMEAGVLALNQLRVRQLTGAGNRNAKYLHAYLESPEDFLWTILIGNTLANFAAVGLVVVLLHAWLGQWPWLLLVSFLAVMFLFYAFFELLPKMLFRMFPNRLTLAMAGPFRFIHLSLFPLVMLVTKLSRGLSRWTGGKAFTGHLFGSREEMRLFMQESSQGFTTEERLMINRVLDLQNLTVRNVAIPMEKVTSTAVEAPMREALKLAQQNRISRVPVWRGHGSQRRIVGVVNLRTVLYQPDLDLAKPAGEYVKSAIYLEEDLRLEEALKRMQRSGQRLAIVLGRDQHETGIVTLVDILKAIFGEVRL